MAYFDFSAYGGAGFGQKDLEAYLKQTGYPSAYGVPATTKALYDLAILANQQGVNIGAGIQEQLKAAVPYTTDQDLSKLGFSYIGDYKQQLPKGGYKTTKQWSWTGMPASTKQAAPAPTAPAPAPTTAAPPPPPKAPTKSMTAAEAILSGVDAMLAQMQDQEAMSAAAAAKQAELQQQASRTLAANMARSQMMPNLQIQPATGVAKDAGTQSFKRRSSQFDLSPAVQSIISGLNAATLPMLNI